jgi:hypothetical protein
MTHEPFRIASTYTVSLRVFSREVAAIRMRSEVLGTAITVNRQF